MSTFKLKRYQEGALEALEKYLRSASLLGAQAAFISETGYGYTADPFGETPCVCLRIPTGGGKTLLGAHAIGRLQREWPTRSPQPLALWLVPSDTIRTQTLAALSTPGHPFRAALAQACGEGVRVCDLDAVATLSPQDFDANAVVIVATMQSFRVEDTDQRNVYSFSEAFEPHFRGVPAAALQALRDLPNALVTAADVAEGSKAGRQMLARFVGQPRWSLANWLALRQPYIIVDEAHNTKTERSFEALKRLNPALILELTATPVPKRTNVLFHVSAQQLQAEDMIKMPIALIEHTRGWQAAVFDAVQNQRLLEAEAQQEESSTGAYIRPIVLIQAQNSTDPVNVDVLRTHIVDELHIPAEQVKVATGTQRELDGLNLADRSCPVRYIITVQALREGWDCPFAYVLCSVQNVRSATAIEQLLGRVLRMPYATRRSRPALNKAYAHVTESDTGMAANALADRLIDGMGFDPLDLASMIAPQLPLVFADQSPRDDGPLFASSAAPAAAAAPLLTLAVDLPASQALPLAVSSAVEKGTATISSDGQRHRVLVRGAIGEVLAAELVAAQPKRQREQVAQQVERHNALVTGAQAPANQSAVFAPVPRLCYRQGAGDQQVLALLEREAVLESVDLNLLARPIQLEGFTLAEQAVHWELYLDGQRTRVGRGDATQLPLDGVGSSITAQDLARWLADELQHPARNVAGDLLPAHLRAFTLAYVNHLMHEKHIPLQQLARHQYPLMQRLALRIGELRDEASRAAFTQLVLGGGWDLQSRHTGPAFEFRFDPACYPVSGNKRYTGKFRFQKHFYPVLADLEDGSEEWRCAMALDEQAQVLHWVRNLDSDPVAGFWLPTSYGRFYPDFVCELKDGRIFVVEYKGEHLRSVPKEIEKNQVGIVWAQSSGGKAVFSMIYKSDRGMSLAQQIEAALA